MKSFKGARMICLLLVIIALACLNTGCRVSDSIMQIIHDQTSTNIDNDGQTHYINDVTGSQNLSDKQPQREKSNQSKNNQDDIQDQAVSGDADSQDTTEKIIAKTKGGDDNETTKKGSGGGDIKQNDSAGRLKDLSSYSGTIAAVGEVASIVCMLGGTDKLIATSESITSNASLYGSSVATAAPIWLDDGEGGTDVFDSLEKLAPKTVILESGSNALTEKQKETLAKAGSEFVTLSKLDTADDIKKDVNEVAAILGTDGAAKKASAYASLHDEIVSRALSQNGGKYTTYGNLDYADGSTLNDGQVKSDMWTLYISDWDSARYVGTWHGQSVVTAKYGVGVSRLGYRSSPLAYYMSVGGAIDTAATFNLASYEGFNMYVWQFNNNHLSAAADNWSGSTVSTKSITGSGTTYSLLRTRDSDWAGLGSSKYPAVIVATKKMQAKMENDRSTSRGLYTPYPFHESIGDTSGVGILVSNTILGSVIGAESTDTSQIASTYGVYVNPHGITSSWTSGSVESPLESLWIAYRFQGLSKSVVKEYVTRFYKDMYGKSLSATQFDRILDGSYCED